MFQEYLKGVSMKFQRSLREFQKSFHGVSIISDESFEKDLRAFQRNFKGYQGYFKEDKQVSGVF